MNGSRRSIPFHVTLLTLMVLIVLPLAAALLWLGWRAVDQLEERGGRPRLAPPDTRLPLMVLIVLPLAAALLWLGWRAVDQLEERSVRHRMAALDSAVEGFLGSGLGVVVGGGR